MAFLVVQVIADTFTYENRLENPLPVGGFQNEHLIGTIVSDKLRLMVKVNNFGFFSVLLTKQMVFMSTNA